MIKPASSGGFQNNNIFTLFFFLSLPAEERHNYWGHKVSCAAAESQPFGRFTSSVTNKGGKQPNDYFTVNCRVYSKSEN